MNQIVFFTEQHAPRTQRAHIELSSVELMQDGRDVPLEVMGAYTRGMDSSRYHFLGLFSRQEWVLIGLASDEDVKDWIHIYFEFCNEGKTSPPNMHSPTTPCRSLTPEKRVAKQSSVASSKSDSVEVFLMKAELAKSAEEMKYEATEWREKERRMMRRYSSEADIMKQQIDMLKRELAATKAASEHRINSLTARNTELLEKLKHNPFEAEVALFKNNIEQLQIDKTELQSMIASSSPDTLQNELRKSESEKFALKMEVKQLRKGEEELQGVVAQLRSEAAQRREQAEEVGVLQGRVVALQGAQVELLDTVDDLTAERDELRRQRPVSLAGSRVGRVGSTVASTCGQQLSHVSHVSHVSLVSHVSQHSPDDSDSVEPKPLPPPLPTSPRTQSSRTSLTSPAASPLTSPAIGATDLASTVPCVYITCHVCGNHFANGLDQHLPKCLKVFLALFRGFYHS